jgi:hypothetical protein
MNRRIPLPPPVAVIYQAVADVEALYPGRKFTLDGHLVGSIGEVVAAEAPASLRPCGELIGPTSNGDEQTQTDIPPSA